MSFIEGLPFRQPKPRAGIGDEVIHPVSQARTGFAVTLQTKDGREVIQIGERQFRLRQVCRRADINRGQLAGDVRPWWAVIVWKIVTGDLHGRRLVNRMDSEEVRGIHFRDFLQPQHNAGNLFARTGVGSEAV